jgi:hypothetical protein
MSTDEQEEKPPILKTWRRVYTLVISVEIIVILFLYFFTQHFK